MLAAAGAAVVVNYRTHPDEAAEVVRGIVAAGGQAVAVQADVSTRPGCQALVDAAVAHFGRLDIAVCNAVRTIRKPVLEYDEADVDAVWQSSLWQCFRLGQMAGRQMVAQGQGGRLIFIGSILSDLPYLNSMPYSAAKSGMTAMARSFAVELAEHNILCNVVEPGWIDTPGEHVLYTDEQIAAAARLQPLRRIGTPEEVAAWVVYLASEHGSYVSGATWRIDGLQSQLSRIPDQGQGPGAG
jgi:glucose 1-dehydrogenase